MNMVGRMLPFLCLIFGAEATHKAKLHNLSELFDLMHHKDQYRDGCKPLFENLGLTDITLQEEAIDQFLKVLRAQYTDIYDDLFTEKEIKDMLKYYRSPTGQKWSTLQSQVTARMQKGYQGMVSIVQKLVARQERATHHDEQDGAVGPVKVLGKDVAGKSDAQIGEIFEQEVQREGLVVVKFSAAWCGPCKSYAPHFERVAQELAIAHEIPVSYIAVDIDEMPAIAEQCGVVSVPTTLFYKAGKKVGQQVGALTESALKNLIAKYASVA